MTTSTCSANAAGFPDRRRDGPERRASEAGPIASAVAASAETLDNSALGPVPSAPDFDVLATLISGPAWSNIGVYVRMAYAMLTADARNIDLGKVTYDLLTGESADDFVDTLERIGQTRIALYQVAEMLKLSVTRQWGAVNDALIAKGEDPIEASDDVSGDNKLLALRPLFEERRAAFEAETKKVASAEKRYSFGHPRLTAAYEAQGNAVEAGTAIAERVTAIRARTKEGIQFKREVRDHWKDCEQPELDASIFADLLAYVEASP